MLPAELITPAVIKLPPVTLPAELSALAANAPDNAKLPPAMLAVTAKLVSVPTEVILVCAAVVNVPTMLVPDKLPPEMLPTAVINPDAPNYIQAAP